MPIITPLLTKLHPHISQCWHGPHLVHIQSQTCFRVCDDDHDDDDLFFITQPAFFRGADV